MSAVEFLLHPNIQETTWQALLQMWDDWVFVLESVAKLLCKDHFLQRPSACRTIPWLERHLTAASSSHQSVSASQSMGKKISVEAGLHMLAPCSPILGTNDVSKPPRSRAVPTLLEDSNNKTLNKARHNDID